MTECRNWLATLWPASYMGVPFFFESDEEKGGRALKVHEYPNSDDHYNEDLGKKPRRYSGAAYVHGDDADAQARTFKETLDSKGPGILVLPADGPVLVDCEDWSRKCERDKLGYIAFQVSFVRAGSPSVIASTLLLGQGIFDAADRVAHSLAGSFALGLSLWSRASYVTAAAVNMVETVAAAIETVRTSNPVDLTVSAQLRDADAAIFAAAPLLISPDPVDPANVAILLASTPPLDETFADPAATLAAAIVATVRLLGDGMGGSADAGAGALLGMALNFPPPAATIYLSAGAALAGQNAAAVTNLARLSALVAWAEALERQTYAGRPDGIAARAAAAERFELELANLSGAQNHDLYAALSDLRGAVVQYLTQRIADLAPVIEIAAPKRLPALWWAWRLYGDPARAVDLVLRNEVKHPSFMPTEFAALAPGYSAPGLPVAWPPA